jgi:hypothetical protein
MKSLVFIVLFFLSITVSAQQQIVQYYDKKWTACAKENAEFYAVFTKADSVFHCNTYWVDKDILRGKSTFRDTSIMSFRIGKQVLYNKNGTIEDSSYYAPDGQAIERLVYHPNQQLALHYKKEPGQDKEEIEAYEKDGTRIKNYIYEKEAEFKGGEKAWQKYVAKNAGTFYSSDETTRVVKVKVQFVVNKEGFPAQIKILESSGVSAVDNDAKRLILESPQWNNAVQFNRPVMVYRIAPFAYELAPASKRKN